MCVLRTNRLRTSALPGCGKLQLFYFCLRHRVIGVALRATNSGVLSACSHVMYRDIERTDLNDSAQTTPHCDLTTPRELHLARSYSGPDEYAAAQHVVLVL